jgi:carboxypeptidase Taq
MAVDSGVWSTFEQRMGEVEDLGATLGLLGWDEQTMCAPKGREARSQHSATLASILHERVVDPAFGDAIETLTADGDGLTDAQRAMVRLAKHDRDRSVRVPAALVRALAEQGSRCNRSWEAARKANDFAIWQPELERMVDLKIRHAEALSTGGDLYDALLEGYEPGMSVADLDPLLGGLRAVLVPFVQELLDRPAPDVSFLAGPFDRDRQRELTVRVLGDFGFDFAAGRQDVSTHPFCGGPGPTDVRMTTRYYDTLEPGALLSSMHECGHGLYQQGLPAAHARTTVAHAPSLGLHESQSRFWENIIGRSRAFWEHYLPVARDLFPAELGGIDLDDFLRGVNHVARTPVRVDADEVTYNLHILVRYELERALLAREVAVADLPAAWNERYVEYLGYTPKHDLEGCMQDIHWSWGEMGYFSTYTLGNLYAAAIRDRMASDLDIDGLTRRGEFAPILGWLRERIHAQGSLRPGIELMRDVTGRPLGHEPLMAYLREKYGALYGL